MKMNTLSYYNEIYFNNLSELGKYISKREIECLSKSLKRFLKTGSKEDAFVIYFCFCEIHQLFGEGYDNTKKLLDLLADHEYHSGELLAKHRDHYSHSVYVFALGLAIFANNKIYIVSITN